MPKLLVALAMAIFTFGFGSIAMSEKGVLPSQDRYAPKQWGLPEMIGGYPVLAVVTEDDTGCKMSGERRLILQAPQPTIDEALRNFPTARMAPELSGWGWSLVGPGLTREQVASRLEETSLQRRMSGCPILTLPNPAEAVELAGELKLRTAYPGFTYITNGDADYDKNAQSVYLVAPKINNNQMPNYTCSGYPITPCHYTQPTPHTAFLNNVITNQDCSFLSPNYDFCGMQVGFAFEKAYDFSPTTGAVVWTDTFHGLGQQPFSPPIDYKEGHHYWTTITFTSGIWWMCAMDIADTATYRCQPSDARLIGSMRHDLRTCIFAENWSMNSDWYTGTPLRNPTDYPDVAWTAYGAAIYTNGIPQPWSYQKVSTQDSCQNNWPPQNAVTGGLENNGSVLIWTNGLPIHCGGATTAPTNHKAVITEVKFPSAIYGDGVPVDGRVKFRDDDAGVNLAQLEPVSDTCGGCSHSFALTFDPEVGVFIEGWIGFAMYCTTTTGFSWTMQVTLAHKDKDGKVSNASAPYPFVIDCKPRSLAR